MTYKMKDLQDIGLVQWNKIGDHPEVKSFNDPKYTLGTQCKICGKNYKEHGLINNPANKPATGYDHFHGKNNTIVCPGDYVFQTINDNNIKQTLVIPEKAYKNISHSLRDSYKETIVDKAITEVIYREYYSREFSFNSDVVNILNTDWTQVSDNYKIESISYEANITLQRERSTDRYIRADKYLMLDSWDIHFIKRSKDGRALTETNDETAKLEEFHLWDWYSSANAAISKLAVMESKVKDLEDKIIELTEKIEALG